jgi:hypothetical protein
VFELGWNKSARPKYLIAGVLVWAAISPRGFMLDFLARDICSFNEIPSLPCRSRATVLCGYPAPQRQEKSCRGRQAGDFMFRLRHLPILLVILASTSAHAEQGFFEQLLDSLKSKAATTSEPAGEPADSTASEPLALQPTTTRRHNQKRSRASRRHSVSAPPRQPEARTGSPTASSKNIGRSSAADPAVPPELNNDSKPVESVLPSADQSNGLPSPAVWPNSAPAPLGAWPDESSGVESAQGDPPRGLQAEAQARAEDNARPGATDVAQQAEPEPFLDSQRIVLAGFSAAWLALGIGMFVFRRQLAKALNARRRQRPHAETRPDAPRALTVILRNAARDGTVAENGGDAERRAVAAG